MIIGAAFQARDAKTAGRPLSLGYLKDQLIVDTEDHLGYQAFGLEFLLDLDHCFFHQVGGPPVVSFISRNRLMTRENFFFCVFVVNEEDKDLARNRR